MPLGLQYMRLVLSRWKLVCILVVGGTLGGWLFSTLVLANNPTFESAARLNIVPTSEELGYANRFVRGSTFDGGSVLLQTYAEFAHTQPIVAPIVDRYIAEQARRGGQSEAAWIAAHSVPPPFSPSRILSQLNYGETPPVPLRQDLIDNVIKNTTIEAVEGTYLLRIGVAWDDPQSAAWFANALADAIVDRAETMSARSGTQIAGSLENRLLTKKAALADMLRRSREMKQAIGVVDLDRQKTALLEAQMAEQAKLTSDRADLLSAQGQVAGLRRQTGGMLSSAQGVLEQTLAIEGPKASGLKDGIAIRERRVGQIGAQIALLGRNEIAIKTLDDQAAALQTEVAALTERVSFSQTENLANAPRIQLIERATPPLVRSSPKTLFNTILGFIAGCALAGCALLLLGEAAPKVRDDEEAAAEEPQHVAPSEPEPRPGFREWREAGRNMVRRSMQAAGNLAVKAAPDFREPEAEPERPQPQPLRIVTNDPPPANAPAPQPGLLFPNVLPRPADDIAYRPDEVASHGRRIARWLASELIDEDRPLLIVGTGRDLDARYLYQLLHDYLKQQGLDTRRIDASRHNVARLVRDDRRPLLYGAGLEESGRRAVLEEVDADVAIILVMSASADHAVVPLLEQASHGIALTARRQPYALAIRG